MAGTSGSYSKAQALRSGGKAPVREALLDARRRTLALADAYAEVLAPAGMQVTYSPGLNPPLWELGHVGWFQEYWVARNRQRGSGVRCDPEHERSSSLLAHADAWYDSGRVEHRSRWTLSLPGAKQTRDYLEATLEQTLELLSALPEDAGDDSLYFFRLVALHEAMHAEAATYMAPSVGVQLPKTADEGKTTAEATLLVPAQTFRVGSGPGGFAFDNELAAHEFVVESFEIDAQPVSWARFLAFVDAAGIERKPVWRAAEARDPHGPAVHLSVAEAQAWCRWAGRRLPNESEWECAALNAPGFDWGRVWEWTASVFEPYPGFVPHPYREYSQPWFGTRRVLRGACDATSPWLAHPRYRNFFEPHRTDIFAGFRSCA